MYSPLEANWGYWQMPILQKVRDRTTFDSYHGAFRSICLLLSLRNAPATFQRSLDLILSGVCFKTCLIYLDDVLIFSRKLEEHIKHVDKVLTLLENDSVSLKLSKCYIFRKSSN